MDVGSIRINFNRSSQTVEIGGCMWEIGKMEKNDERVSIIIRCESPRSLSEGWSCDVKLNWTPTYSNDDDSDSSLTGKTKKPPRIVAGHCFKMFCETQRQHEVVFYNGPFKIEKNITTVYFRDNRMFDYSLTLSMWFSEGLRFGSRKLGICEPSTYADLILLVQDRKFYVSKTLLCLHSPVFEKMLCGKFVESRQKEVVIEEAQPEIVADFLGILHNHQFCVSDNNVNTLLELSDRFDVPYVAQKCQEFLRSHYTMFSLAERFSFADKFSLEGLKFDCLWEVSRDPKKCREELEQTKSFSDLSDKMQGEILKLLLKWKS